MEIKATTSRLPELDALRGIAAIAVVFCHITLNRPQGEHIFKYGFTGVDLFFMISGFVISMSLKHVQSGKEFVLRRITRLYPAYWFAVSLTAVLLLLTHLEHLDKHYLLKYVANLSMFQPYVGQGNIDDSYWTLIVEMQFYIFMLIVYWLGKLKAIEIIGFIILILLIACACILHYRQPSPVHMILFYRYCSIAICFPLFFAGIIYYQMLFDRQTISRYLLLLMCFGV